jgi:hypothetical protein
MVLPPSWALHAVFGSTGIPQTGSFGISLICALRCNERSALPALRVLAEGS